MSGDVNGYQASLAERKQEVSALCSSLGAIFHPQPPPTFQTSWSMIRKATGSANSGQGLDGHSIHVGILITSHQTAQRLGSALLFQCPMLPGPSALWQDTLPLSWKHQVKLVRSFTNHSLCPSNSPTLLSSPGQKVRLKLRPTDIRHGRIGIREETG